MQLLTDTMKTNVIIIIVVAPLVKKVGCTLAFKVIQVSRWNVDRARLVRPHSYLSFTCATLYLHFGSMQRVCAVISSTGQSLNPTCQCCMLRLCCF